MKKLLFLFLTFFLSGSAFLFGQINDSGNHGLMTITLKNKDLSDIKGTPYLEENYKSGKLLMNGKETLTAFMRYDVQNEIIEIKTDLESNEVFVLPPGKNAKYKIDNRTFLNDRIMVDGERIQGYFIEHFNGNNFRLLEKPVVTLTDPVKAKTGYEKDKPAAIRIKSKFYVQKENGEIDNIRLKHKDIKKSFTSKQANDYLKKNRIKTIDDLTNFLIYLDQK